MTRSRKLVTLTAIALVVAPLAACGHAHRDVDDLRAALSRTQELARAFVYSDKTQDQQVDVRGLIEDGFRYKARLSLQGNDTWDEVAVDDALADRFIDPSVIPTYVRRANTTTGTESGNTPSTPTPVTPDSLGNGPSPLGRAPANVLAALQARRWVIDPIGAPSLLPRGQERHLLGDDPLYDALTILRYADSVANGLRIEKFSPENLDYKASEDPFPKPSKSSNVFRYDYVTPPLPHPNQGVAGTAVPGLANFRKLSVYVKDGRVLEVRERVDVEARLRDLTRIYGLKFPRGSTTRERVNIALQAMNELNRGAGSDPIVTRDRVLKFDDLGSKQSIALPTDNVTNGTLAFLIDRGPQLGSKAASANGTNSQTTTSTGT